MLLGRECKGVVVAVVVVKTALPGAQAVGPAATQEQPAVVCGQSLSRALRQWWWTSAWGRTWTTADPTKHDQQGWQHECWCRWWWWWWWWRRR